MRIPHRALRTIGISALLVGCSASGDLPEGPFPAPSGPGGFSSSTSSSSTSSGDPWPDEPDHWWECSLDEPCRLGEYCKAAYESSEGFCAPSGNCNAQSGPVCGRNRHRYANECEAFSAGVDVGGLECAAPRNMFWCDLGPCKAGDEVCLGYDQSPRGCSTLTETCKTLGCDCWIGSYCTCSTDANGNQFVMCYSVK